MNINYPTYLWKSELMEMSVLGMGLDNVKG